MSKLVSIVLPVYNGEKYLAKSIESVLNQTYNNLELIIVNDCSTDRSEDIILKYAATDSRIVYVKNQINSKLPQSLNNGFAIANGDYYTWTSDDNYYYSNAIEVMVSYLEMHPKTTLVYCDYNLINQTGDWIGHVAVGESDELYFDNIVGACFLYRSSITYEIGQYDTNMFLVEDYEYWLRILIHGTINPLHVCLYDYRMHENSLTLTKKQEIEKALEKLQFMYLRRFEKNRIDDEILFSFFEYIIIKKRRRIERLFMKFSFAFRHKKYFRIFIKRRTDSIITKIYNTKS